MTLDSERLLWFQATAAGPFVLGAVGLAVRAWPDRGAAALAGPIARGGRRAQSRGVDRARGRRRVPVPGRLGAGGLGLAWLATVWAMGASFAIAGMLR